MKLTLILTLLASLVTTGLFSQPALAQNKGDEVVLEMQRAYGKNDAKRLSALLPQVRGHVLEPLAAYWEMRVRLDTASDSEIRQFLNTYAGSYYEDRLRNDWLQQLGKRRSWATFTAEYPRFRMRDDREVRCYALATEAMNTKADVAEEAKRIWYSLREADDGLSLIHI
jgi:soluble lytic murein transglycosylase